MILLRLILSVFLSLHALGTLAADGSISQISIVLESNQPLARLRIIQDTQTTDLVLLARRPQYAKTGYQRLDRFGGVELDSRTGIVTLRYCFSPVAEAAVHSCPGIQIGKLGESLGDRAYRVVLSSKVKISLKNEFNHHQGMTTSCNNEIMTLPICSYDYYTHNSRLQIVTPRQKIEIVAGGEDSSPEADWILSQTETVTVR